jgi:hypothetical protein
MTKERLPWFQCYPSKLLGALAGMPPDVGYTYTVVLLRTYEVCGPCPDTEEVLARRTGLSRRKISTSIEWLIAQGKLTRIEGGLANPFASEVLAESAAFYNGRKKAGKAGAEKRWQKPKENQGKEDGSAIAEPMENDSHLHLQKKKERTEANASGAEAPIYTDSRHELWGEGIPILMSLGMAEKSARGMVGRWLKQAGDDAQKVLSVIQRARDLRVIDPMPWITKAITTGGANGKTTDAKVGFSGIAARLRQQARADDEAELFRPRPEDLQPVNRR